MNRDKPGKHPLQVRSSSHRRIAFVRVGVGVWLLFLAAILHRAGIRGPLQLLLVGFALLHFGLAYRLFRIAKDDPDSSVRFR